MYVDATSSNSQTTTAQSTNNASLDTTFLQLLTAQLRNQDPISPMDPNQFLGQLVQLNSLEQLIAIRQLLAPQPATSPTQGGH